MCRRKICVVCKQSAFAVVLRRFAAVFFGFRIAGRTKKKKARQPKSSRPSYSSVIPFGYGVACFSDKSVLADYLLELLARQDAVESLYRVAYALGD